MLKRLENFKKQIFPEEFANAINKTSSLKIFF